MRRIVRREELPRRGQVKPAAAADLGVVREAGEQVGRQLVRARPARRAARPRFPRAPPARPLLGRRSAGASWQGHAACPRYFPPGGANLARVEAEGDAALLAPLALGSCCSPDADAARAEAWSDAERHAACGPPPGAFWLLGSQHKTGAMSPGPHPDRPPTGHAWTTQTDPRT